MDKRITINDVAKAAGVSKGTVDRVMHNRGEVSEKSRARVLEVVRQLGFRPNVYASLLASRKEFVIVCMVPEHNPGEFWEITVSGINKGAEDVARFGIEVKTFTFDQYDVISFRTLCAKVLEINPSGVVLPPMFSGTEIQPFARALSSREIPLVFIDSKPSGCDYFAYFGMDNYRSGILCANLLLSGATPEAVTLSRISRDKAGLSDPTANRRQGFLDYMAQYSPMTPVNNIMIDPNDRDRMFDVLNEAYASDPQSFAFLVMLDSRVHLLADWVTCCGIKGIRIVGFDALAKNLDAIKNETVQMIVAQHNDRQAFDAINAIANLIVHRQRPRSRDNFCQMDILNKFNCDYYALM